MSQAFRSPSRQTLTRSSTPSQSFLGRAPTRSGSFFDAPLSGLPVPRGLGLSLSRSPTVVLDEDDDMAGRSRVAKRNREEGDDGEDGGRRGVASRSYSMPQAGKRRGREESDEEDAAPSQDWAYLDEDDEGLATGLSADLDEDEDIGLASPRAGAAASKRHKADIFDDDDLIVVDDDDTPSAVGPATPFNDADAMVLDTPASIAPPKLARAPSLDYGGLTRPSKTVDLPQVSDEAWTGPKPAKVQGGAFTAAVTRVAKKGGLDIEPKPNRGMIVSDTHLHGEQPDELDFRGYRSRQVLHHHSEVLKWHLRRTVNAEATAEAKAKYQADLKAYPEKLAAYQKRLKAHKGGKSKPRAPSKPVDPGNIRYKPVEVQSQYVTRGGRTRLDVSANEAASQNFMRNMTQADIAAMYEAAASQTGEGKEDSRARKSALKILEMEALDAQRRKAMLTADKGKPHDNPYDLDRALELAQRAREGRYGVVLNEGGRHAEQNLNEAYEHDVRTTTDDTSGDERDVAGTFIRCGACSTQLGGDETYRHIHEQTTGKKELVLTGTLYAHEMTPTNFSSAAPEYVDDAPRGRSRTRAMTIGEAERARSRSPAPRRRARPSAPAPSAPIVVNSAPPSAPPKTVAKQPAKQTDLTAFFSKKFPSGSGSFL